MTVEQIITLVVAIYGALLSTMLVIREVRKDRRKLFIVLEHVALYERVQIIITNIGDRPVTITEIEVRTFLQQDGNTIWDRVPRNALLNSEETINPFPATINEGEHVTLPLSEVVRQELTNNGMKAKIVIYDVEGKKYRTFKTRLHNPRWGSYDLGR